MTLASAGVFFLFARKKVLAICVNLVYNKSMKKENKDNKVICSARIDKELYDIIEARANAENRSVSNMVETLLKKAVADK